MKTEILATGNELITGNLIDTNSAYLAEQLRSIGIEVSRQSCVGDKLKTLVDILLEISARAKLAIVTGGLGPTPDDLSTKAAAKASNKNLVLNQNAVKSIEAFLKKKHQKISKAHEKQAYFPKNSVWFENTIGSAPGFSCLINKCRFIFLPGVPSEMKAMLSSQIIPYIQKLPGRKKIFYKTKTISTFGLSEAIIGEHLKKIQKKFKNIEFGTRVTFPTTQIKLYAKGTNKQQIESSIKTAIKTIREAMSNWVFSETGKSMAQTIARLLEQKQVTIAVAESCTGGLIAHWLTSIPGSSEYFLLSAVTYANKAKENIIKVSPSTLKKYGAVSKQTVAQMASNVRKLINADYALATSGIAGPSGGTKQKPNGTVCIAIASKNKVESYRYFFPFGKREHKKQIFAMCALDLLRRELLDLPLTPMAK